MRNHAQEQEDRDNATHENASPFSSCPCGACVSERERVEAVGEPGVHNTAHDRENERRAALEHTDRFLPPKRAERPRPLVTREELRAGGFEGDDEAPAPPAPLPGPAKPARDTVREIPARHLVRWVLAGPNARKVGLPGDTPTQAAIREGWRLLSVNAAGHVLAVIPGYVDTGNGGEHRPDHRFDTPDTLLFIAGNDTHSTAVEIPPKDA